MRKSKTSFIASDKPDIINVWYKTPEFRLNTPAINWSNKTLTALATMAIIKRQLRRMSQGLKPKLTDSPFLSLLIEQIKNRRRTKVYRSQLKEKSECR
ncbi:hypothetical protein [Shewanella sp. ULN5]|uniref:hypothetical protein n=1 Tax=Shewanella sp. ULN5 TaxID=2994678 RepID=UPI0035325AA1